MCACDFKLLWRLGPGADWLHTSNILWLSWNLFSWIAITAHRHKERPGKQNRNVYLFSCYLLSGVKFWFLLFQGLCSTGEVLVLRSLQSLDKLGNAYCWNSPNVHFQSFKQCKCNSNNINCIGVTRFTVKYFKTFPCDEPTSLTQVREVLTCFFLFYSFLLADTSV